LRQDRLLRPVAEPPRTPARNRGRASDHPLRSARRGLELVLRRRPRLRHRPRIRVMDEQINGRIEQLVAEEHELWEREAAGAATDEDRRRLRSLRVSLD